MECEVGSTKANQDEKPLRMVEFFSGIGGMRCSLERALATQQPSSVCPLVKLASCKAYEIHLEANQVYESNFCSCSDFSVHTKLVEQLKVHEVNGFDLWTMSPPCQPFTNTRFAKQGDLNDSRMKGFLSVLKLLENLNDIGRPKWILLENVKGFAESQARTKLLDTLHHCGYSWKEYLLTPVQFGIPNHRKRYYILCEASERFFDHLQHEQHKDVDKICTVLPDLALGTALNQTRCISHYLDDYVDWKLYGLDREILSQPWARDLPLVGPLDSHSHCFTSFYSRHLHKSTGSLLLAHPDIPSVAAVVHTLDRSDMTRYTGCIRKFTPSELLRIFGFPASLLDHSNLRLQTKYKLIGNSINVTVVSILLQILLQLNVGVS